MSVQNVKKYRCEICNKDYSSRQSLCNHNTKFHRCTSSTCNPPNSTNNSITAILNEEEKEQIKYNCEYCNKEFSRSDSLKRHYNRCEKYSIKKENTELKKQLDEIKKHLLDLLNKNAKVHPKTIEKINKKLAINGNNNNVNNSKNTINFNIIKFGSENISQLLNQKEKIEILENKFKSLEASIKSIHFNDKRPEYNNILITNLRDNIAYIFDGEKFKTTKKSVAINELVNNHMENIEISFEEYKKKLSPFTIKKLEEFIERMNNENAEVIAGDDNKKYDNFKLYKMDEIKEFIYDESRNIKQIKNFVHEEIEDKSKEIIL